MKNIASFNVDHTCLVPGIYLSRRDGDVVTFDLRFKKPNTGDLLSNAELHSVEHIIATFLRNSTRQESVIYFGPMGCQTGFYFLFDSKTLAISDAITLLQDVFSQAALYHGPMPGQSARECGNYINLDGELSRICCSYFSQIIQSWDESKLVYPT